MSQHVINVVPVAMMSLLLSAWATPLMAQELLDSPAATIPPLDESLENLSEQAFELIPMGVKLGDQNVRSSTLIKGAENGEQALKFEQWRIAFSDVVEALSLQITPIEGDLVEVRSPGSVFRLDLSSLLTDEDLGLAFSMAQIQELLTVPVTFDINEYAIVFQPPWLNQPLSQTLGERRSGTPISLDGLPKIRSSNFSLSAIGQDIVTLGGEDVEPKISGNFEAVGSLLGGSWYAAVDQEDLGDPRTWQLDELQYLRQRPTNDLVIGSQPFFWPEGSGDYVGVTAIRRFGFTPQIAASSGNGFSPSQRLSSRRVQRDIRGKAEPGTLVQLVSNIGNIVVDEILVDSSGIYRFEDVTTAFSLQGRATLAGNYRLLLYPRGQLAAPPEVRSASFSSLPGQLSKGTSALLLSAGIPRNQNEGDFLGEFEDRIQGGIAYRWGASDSLTLGAGLFYDEELKGSAELFWQPSNIPLRVRADAVFNSTQKDGDHWFRYNADVSYQPTRSLDLSFNSDELSQRARVHWRVLPNLGFNAHWNSAEQAFAFGANGGFRTGEITIQTGIDIDTNSNISWDLSSYYRRFSLEHQGNELGTNSSLEYILGSSVQPFSRNSSVLFLNYDTSHVGIDQDPFQQLAIVGWRYRGGQGKKRNFKNWNFNIGYGVGSQGSGVIASAGLDITSGLSLSAGYRNISLRSNESSFNVFLSSNASFSPRFSLTDEPLNRLRNEGGLVLIPFYDENSNGVQDKGEKIYTEDIRRDEAGLFFLLNNRDIKTFTGGRAEVRGNGLFFTLSPGSYRFDIDPAGAPIGWQVESLSYALSISPGSYTPIRIPIRPAYTLAGYLLNDAGEPLRGVRVEAVSLENPKKRSFSITNSAGVYYLESLDRGKYQLFVDDFLTQPGQIEFDQDSDLITEVNLTYSE